MKSRLKRRRKKVVRAPFLHRAVEYKLAMFLQYYPPKEFNREFRNMIVDYLIYRNGGINYRIDQKVLIEGVWDLMRVLDEAENHWEYRDTDDIINKYNALIKARDRKNSFKIGRGSRVRKTKDVKSPTRAENF